MKSDSLIQNDVIEELKWAPQVNSADIGVSVRDGIVTLTGNVKTYAQKLEAEKAAICVKGVKAVAEEIKVGANLSLVKTDKEIAQAVLDALKWHTSIDENLIQVTVENGFVILTGQVNWDYQRRAARSAIDHLEGVIGVENDLTIKPHAMRTDVREKIIDAFKRSAALDAELIHVDVFGSRVVLSGSVRNLLEKNSASNAAWSAPGITIVENELQVLPEKQLAY